MQGRRSGLKGFFTRTIGKIILMVVAVLAVVGAFLFASVLFAILAAIIFGLGIPIWAGAKSTRYLAVMGVVILAASPALVTAIEVPLLLAPPGVSSSTPAIMQNASVTPYQGSANQMYTWSVEVFPSSVPAGSAPINLTLYVSTCPGATGPSDPNCSSGYPLDILTTWYNGMTYVSGPTNIANLSATTTFTLALGNLSANIWSYQIGVYYGTYSNSTHQWGNASFLLLNGDPTYNSISGPVTTDAFGVYSLLVGSIYLSILLYVGLVFYIALLIYLVFRTRRQRRQETVSRMRPPPPSGPTVGSAAPLPSTQGGGGPPGSAGTAGAAGTPGRAAAPTAEVACPNCGAVVYPNETFCWKCGAALSTAAKGGSPPATGPKG